MRTIIFLLMFITGTVQAHRDSLYIQCKYNNPITKKIEKVLIHSTIDHICVKYENGKEDCYESESWPAIYKDRTIYSFKANDAPGYLLFKQQPFKRYIKK